MSRRPLTITLLRALLPIAERDEIAADVEAEFVTRCAEHGRPAAKRWLRRQFVRSVPALVRRMWWRGFTGFDPRANAMNPGGPLMERLLLETRYALRRLRTRPAYTLLAVLTLALGVGGMAAISGIARTLLLGELPYRNVNELAEFWAPGQWRAPEWLAIRHRFTGFAAVAAYRMEDMTLERDGARTRLVTGVTATHELFDVLGVAPLLGRGFAAGEDALTTAPLVVLSHKLWQELGGQPSIVGSLVKLDGVQRTVIGVMPSGFWFPYPTIEAWINEHVDPNANYGVFTLVGRVGSGLRLDNMQPALANITQILGAQFKYSVRYDKTKNAALIPLHERAVNEMRPALLATLAGMAIILLIACANVAALVLSQVESRSSELALRSALGAERGRLATQLLIEVLALGAVAAAIGSTFASAGFSVLRGALPLGAWSEHATLDWRLFAITTIVALIAALVVALLPMVAVWRSDLRVTLAGARTSGVLRRRGGLQAVMVVSEVALAVLLACAAGLLVRSVAKLYAIRPGIETRGIAVIDLATPVNLGPVGRQRLLKEIVRDLEQLPGVSRVAVSQRIPLRGNGWSAGLKTPNGPSDAPAPFFRLISPGYFATLGIPLRAGRTFVASDVTKDTLQAIVVSEALAKIYFPGEDPIGKVVKSNLVGGSERIVGVVGNVAEGDLKDEMPATRYILSDNIPFVPDVQTILLRTARPEDDERILAAARQAVFKIAPSVAVQEATTMSRVLDRAVGPARSVMTLLALLTGLALALGAIGIYGVISQLVSRRKREWGIRVALGLAPRRVVTLVVRHGTSLVVAGIAIGVAGSALLTQLLSSFLYGVTTSDPIAIVAAAFVLLAVGTIAALIPAVRASRTDPALVLREQ